MNDFDHDYVEEVIERLGTIPPEQRPAWGALTPKGLVAHLADLVRYSMGKGPVFPDGSTWLSRHVVRPLLLRGIIGIPRNIQAPKALDGSGGAGQPADLETLHALLEEYLGLVETGELTPPCHFLLGDLGVDGWARLHVVHFEHHLHQFGV